MGTTDISTPPPPPSKTTKYSKEQLLEMYRLMYAIRRFEEACGEHYTLGHIRGFLHLYIGQEATAVGSISTLTEKDYIVSHYRDHGHALARGMEMKTAMAELFGKQTGSSKGKGGSMHLFDVGRRFMGGHAIVGGQIPLSLGLAFAQRYRKEDGLTLCYFGDGATMQGVYHESLNLASLWKLPVVFCLENNGYGMGTSLERARAGGADIWKSVASYKIEALEVDGMDVTAVRDAFEDIAKYVRSGNGPFFIEAKTYRYEGHSLADGQKYRDSSHADPWLKRDPLITFPERLLSENLATDEDLNAVKEEVDNELREAVQFAEQSPEPDPTELNDDIYA